MHVSPRAHARAKNEPVSAPGREALSRPMRPTVRRSERRSVCPRCVGIARCLRLSFIVSAIVSEDRAVVLARQTENQLLGSESHNPVLDDSLDG